MNQAAVNERESLTYTVAESRQAYSFQLTNQEAADIFADFLGIPVSAADLICVKGESVTINNKIKRQLQWSLKLQDKTTETCFGVLTINGHKQVALLGQKSLGMFDFSIPLADKSELERLLLSRKRFDLKKSQLKCGLGIIACLSLIICSIAYLISEQAIFGRWAAAAVLWMFPLIAGSFLSFRLLRQLPVIKEYQQKTEAYQIQSGQLVRQSDKLVFPQFIN